MRHYPLVLLAAALCLSTSAALAQKTVPKTAIELRNRGIAELENEKPELAEEHFRQLTEVLPKDPIGSGNLAIAELRQQKNNAALATIDKALTLAPGRADLLAIKSEVLQWTGDLEGALGLMKQAADAAPDDLEILYAAYQLATTLRTDSADAIAGEVLRRLARLRPENLVVILQLGQRAIAAGDRPLATAAFLRVEQLVWQGDEMANRALEMVKDALKGDDVSQARVPAIRLSNVLKVTAMHRESQRELKTGIQGIPIFDFLGQPVIDAFGDPVKVEFAGTRLDERPNSGRALATGDFDGDGKADLARIRQDAKTATLEVRRAEGGWKVSSEYAAGDLDELLAADLDNDGHLDLIASSATRGMVWLGSGDGTFTEAPEALGLSAAGASAAVVIDFDIEGDIDLAVTGGTSGPGDLYRNSLEGPLERVGTRSLPRLPIDRGRAIVASDLDRDGDLDLLIGHARGLTWVDNLRQGRFVDRSVRAGLRPSYDLDAAISADLDNDGLPDLIGGGRRGIQTWHNHPPHNASPQDRGGRFEPWDLPGLSEQAAIASLHAFDADNDGRLDLAAAGSGGVWLLTQQPTADGPSFQSASIADGPKIANAVTSADLDLDGDLDVVIAGPEGLHWLENRGGNSNGWIAVRLRGLDKGNSKNNFYGVGSTLEVSSGQAYQFREAEGDVVHLGIGQEKSADVLRVVWTNGVPQNRLQVEGQQRLVEEQLLKGSCPFLYAWDGEQFAFVSDLLWGAPLGLPVAPGVYAGSHPQEIVQLDAEPVDGIYQLRITEELWEAAYFDVAKLWVVDTPQDLEVASNLRIVPGQPIPSGHPTERVLASRDLRPVARAWDGTGRDVTQQVQRRDEVYADGYVQSRYQGVAAEPWTFTIDLGTAPNAPVRLHLDGWIFPADASLNLAVAQRSDLPYLAPRLEVETAEGWQELIANMGHPAGKTKTMVVDTPALPTGATKLRMVTSLWLHWDRIAWTTAVADDAPIVRAKLAPKSADLRYRGFSALVRESPNAPHSFDYASVSTDSPWMPFPGNYTRYGDVRELLAEPDDFLVVMAPGDEIVLTFDASELPPPAPGHHRTLFLESHGWDKDADRNTFEAQQLEPLPFRAMTGYPFAEGESYPDTPAHRAYQEEWQTRAVN